MLCVRVHKGLALTAPPRVCSPVLDVLGAAAVSCTARFKPKELAQLLHAVGSAGRAPAAPGWAAHMWTACEEALPQFQAHELSIVLWAFARIKHSPGDEALRAAAAQLASHAGGCDIQVCVVLRRLCWCATCS